MDWMNIPNTWIVFIWIGLVNVLWMLIVFTRPTRTRKRPGKYANKWIESRSRSDSK